MQPGPLPEFRVFISSPRDVRAERARALRVIERLNGEYRDTLRLSPVAWEEKTYTADKDFQSQIEAATASHLVVGILWARTGHPLDAQRYHRPDGSAYESGTVFEIETALERARHGSLPDVALFHKDIDPPLERDANPEQQVAQLRLLNVILRRWMRTEEGAFKGAFNHFRSTDEFASLLEHFLRDWLAKRGQGLGGPVWRIESDADTPYPGLAAYEARHECVFFGRAAARERCRELLAEAAGRGCAFLLILGASGSGKSSLARAGLLPRLALPGSAPGVDSWRVAELRPGVAPLAALARALFAPGALPELAEGDAPAPAEWAATVEARPQAAAGSVAAALRRAGGGAPGGDEAADEPRTVRLFLLADQLEEAFDASAAERAAFAAALDALARSGLVWVIATLRADRYGGVQAEPALLALKRDGAVYDLPLPGPAEFDEIVRGPARAAGLAFERRAGSDRDLGDVLLAETAGADALPLLQMTLAQLFQERERGDGEAAGTLTFAAYERLGGLDGAIRRRAEEVFGATDQEARRELPALLLALAGGLTEAGQVTARPVRAADLATTPPRARLLRALVDGRLLLTERRDTAGPVSPGNAGPDAAKAADAGAWVRVAHEALLRNWPRAQEVLEPERIRVKVRLESLLAEWEARGRTRRYLLPPGPILEAAADLRRVHGVALPPALVGFIVQSLQAARARWRRTLAGAGALVAVFAGLAGLSLYYARDAGKQRAEAVAQRAEAVAQTKVAETRRMEAEASADDARQAKDAAEAERKRAEANFAVAQDAANVLVFDIAQSLRDQQGMRAETVRRVLDRALGALDRLIAGVQGDAQLPLLRLKAVALAEFSTTYASLGDTHRQREAAEAALAIAERLAAQDPGNAGRQRDLSVIHNKVGDVLLAQGDRAGALASYQASLAVAERLAAENPGNAELQRDLSVGHDRIGDMLVAQGDRAGALASYQASLAVAERLAAQDPGNALWQRDLSVSHNNVGNVLVAQGDRAGALASYQASLAIRERLAAEYSGNADLQRDLSTSHERIGDVLRAQDDQTGALRAYRDGLAIRERLAAQDPNNAKWQRDLSVIYNRIGEVLVAQRDIEGALKAYGADLAIAERLATKDPNNAEWQRDLVVSHYKLGMALLASRDPAARDHALRALAQARRWAERFPQDPRRDATLRAVEDLVRRTEGTGEPSSPRSARPATATGQPAPSTPHDEAR